MGVDAIMRVETSETFSDEQLCRWAWALAGAFYREPFCCDKGCLTRVGAGEIEVNLASRYYGEGYERGPITEHCAIAEWLEANIPGARVYYGDDCSDQIGPFGVAERRRLLAHFHRHGHFPYVGAFSFCPPHNAPVCPACQEPLLESGGGGDQTFWFCYGCSRKAITYPSGVHFYSEGDVFEISRQLRQQRTAATTQQQQRPPSGDPTER